MHAGCAPVQGSLGSDLFLLFAVGLACVSFESFAANRLVMGCDLLPSNVFLYRFKGGYAHLFTEGMCHRLKVVDDFRSQVSKSTKSDLVDSLASICSKKSIGINGFRPKT